MISFDIPPEYMGAALLGVLALAGVWWVLVQIYRRERKP